MKVADTPGRSPAVAYGEADAIGEKARALKEVVSQLPCEIERQSAEVVARQRANELRSPRNLDDVELFLNDRSLGRKKPLHDPVPLPLRNNGSFTSKYRLLWEVPYEAGTLRAVGYKNGQVVLEDQVRTAGKPMRIVLQPDRDRIAADGEDLSFITVRIEDDHGNLCPLADNLVRFKVAGAGRIAAVDNGNAATTEPFQADQRKAFSGRCMLIVRSNRAQPGQTHGAATAEGLQDAEESIQTGR